MLNEINEYILDYDTKKQKEEQENKIEEADDDGWIQVKDKKNNRNKALIPHEKTIKKLKLKEKKKQKEKELLNFYTFQMRESKKDCEYLSTYNLKIIKDQ